MFPLTSVLECYTFCLIFALRIKFAENVIKQEVAKIISQPRRLKLAFGLTRMTRKLIFDAKLSNILNRSIVPCFKK